MDCLEHYFENLLYYGEDVKGDVNKNQLSEEAQDAVERCAIYIGDELNKYRWHDWSKEIDEKPEVNSNVIALLEYADWSYYTLLKDLRIEREARERVEKEK